MSVPQFRTGVANDECFYHFWRIAQQSWPIIEIPAQRCDMAHNMAAIYMMRHNEQKYLEGKPEETFTHLVTLDADHKHPPHIVYHLGKVVQTEPDKLVVGGLNFRRSEPWEPCAFTDYAPGWTGVVSDWEPGIDEVAFVGAGSMIINADVFQAFKDEGDYPFFGYTYDVPGSDEFDTLTWEQLAGIKFPGVDMWFSKLCQKHEIKLWLDSRITSPHLGKLWIDEKMWQGYRTTEACHVKHRLVGYRLDRLHEHIPELWAEGGQVLYVGANQQRAHCAAELAQAGHTLTLLEINKRNLDHYQHQGPFDYLKLGDVTEYESKPGIYDVAFWWHGPEHVTPEQLPAALANLEAAVGDGGLVVIGCPLGKTEQGTWDGNPYEEHKAGYYPPFFEHLGYTVITCGEKDTPESGLTAWKHIGGT